MLSNVKLNVHLGTHGTWAIFEIWLLKSNVEYCVIEM
jgi:hypothetical protein